MLGLSCISIEGISSSILYIAVYIGIAGFIWGFVSCVSSTNGRTLYLTNYIQWIKTNPALGTIATSVVFSIAGIPPLGGFFSKFAIFLSYIELGLFIPILIGLIISSIGVLYYLRLVKIVSFEEIYWKKSPNLKANHVIAIGLFGFSVNFFVIYSDLIYLITQEIVIQVSPIELKTLYNTDIAQEALYPAPCPETIDPDTCFKNALFLCDNTEHLKEYEKSNIKFNKSSDLLSYESIVKSKK